MANSEELIGTTEHVTLYTRYRLNRYLYNRVLLYLPLGSQCLNVKSIGSLS